MLNIIDQILNSTDLEAPFPPKLQTCVSSHHTRLSHHGLTRHRFSVIDHLRNNTSGRFPSQSTKLESSLGMASPFKNTAIFGFQRENVSWASEAGRRDLGACQSPTCQGTIVRRDSRRDARVVRVNGDGVRRAMRVLTVHHHLRQLQLDRQLRRDGRTYESARVSDHECHFLGRDILGGDDQISFVLAVLGIQHDDELAVAEGFDRRLDRVKSLGQRAARRHAWSNVQSS